MCPSCTISWRCGGNATKRRAIRSWPWPPASSTSFCRCRAYRSRPDCRRPRRRPLESDNALRQSKKVYLPPRSPWTTAPQRRGNMRTTVVLLLLTTTEILAQGQTAPSIDDLINLKRVGAPAISPNAQQVAFTVRETNWNENAYETEIWIGDAATGQSRQVTNGRGSSQQPAWSPDGASLAFVSDRDGRRQLYRIAVSGGEAEKLTSGDEAV